MLWKIESAVTRAARDRRLFALRNAFKSGWEIFAFLRPHAAVDCLLQQREQATVLGRTTQLAGCITLGALADNGCFYRKIKLARDET